MNLKLEIFDAGELTGLLSAFDLPMQSVTCEFVICLIFLYSPLIHIEPAILRHVHNTESSKSHLLMLATCCNYTHVINIGRTAIGVLVQL